MNINIYMQKARKIPRKDDKLIEKINQTYDGDKVVPYMGNSSLPSKESTFEYDKDRVKVILRCSENILYFAQHFFYIISAGEKIKINLHPFQRDSLRMFRDHQKSIMNCSRQVGKALELETPIPTPTGWTTMGKLTDGDTVYDETGNPCNVVKAHDIMSDRECYKLTFDNGEEIVADEGHLWFTQTHTDRGQRSKDKVRLGSVKTTKAIFDTQLYGNAKPLPNHRIKRSIDGVCGSVQNLSIDPYLLGMWLGDGHSGAARISVGKEDIDQFKKVITWNNISVNEDKRGVYYVGFLKENGNYFTHLLKGENLFNNKHIPNIYKLSSRSQRLELLKGLMDTEGTVRSHNGGCEISLSNKKLVDDVYELILSLGYKATFKEKTMSNPNHSRHYRINFKPHDIVFKYDRKREKQTLPFDGHDNRINYHYITKVEKVDSVPVRCISVDSKNNLFMCGKTYIPSHNTTLMTIYALWLVTLYDWQHIVIVANKEKTAQEILDRIRLAYTELPNWLKPTVESWAKQEVKFTNGSKIQISATSADAIRGKSCNCVDGSSVVTIKDKDTDTVFDITMEELSNNLENNGELHGFSLIDE